VVDCGAARAALLACEPGTRPAPAIEAHLADCVACRPWRRRLRALDGALGALPLALTPAPAEGVAPPPFERIARPAAAAARGRRRLRALRRALPLTLAAACAAGFTVGITRLSHHTREAVARAGQVVDGSRSVAQALLADGARVAVASGRAVVALSEPRRAQIQLESGSAFVSVPHLGADASFLLTTEEAEVRVRGTRFDVERGAHGTRVSVSEGVVEVQPRDTGVPPFLLGRGEARLVEGRAARRQAARAAALASIEQREDSTTADRIQAWLATDPPAEEAAEAHALLAWKLSRDGDRANALRSYQRALALLPAGVAPLWADNACAQLALLVERQDARAGAAAWQGYLQRFPAGVHAALAHARLASANSATPGRRRGSPSR
jgi:ferric-dicitrate binding protein FerR (iron transport regulator)